MEGSHDVNDLNQIIDLTFKPYKNLREVNDQVTVLKAVTRLSSVDTPALLGTNVFKVPYLASGCPGTADYNCFKMSKAVRMLYRIHSGREFMNKESEERFLTHFRHLLDTVDLIRGLHEGKLLEIFKFFGMKLETVCYITDFEALWKDNDYIELDLLGFGIGKFHMPDVKTFIWPVLSNPLNKSPHYLIRPDVNRLGRSLIFHKDRDLEEQAEEDATFYNASEAERRITSAAKCISAMVNGAWIRKDYMQICRAVVERVKIIHRMAMG